MRKCGVKNVDYTVFKNGTQVYSVEDKYYLLFGQRLETSIIEEMLDYDPALKANYELYQELYQELLQAVTNKDFEALSSCLTNPLSPLISSYMRTNLKTLRKHLPFIQNTLIYPYNNGRIEGINNKIKVLNRVAYGYRNFQNYKKRIILDFKLKPLETSHKQKNDLKAA